MDVNSDYLGQVAPGSEEVMFPAGLFGDFGAI